jgi:hypothetical protein
MMAFCSAPLERGPCRQTGGALHLFRLPPTAAGGLYGVNSPPADSPVVPHSRRRYGTATTVHRAFFST